MENKMLLDATTFGLVLTPEAALGVVQRVVTSKGWKKYDVSDIKLVYVPFYVFSFDISAGEQSPSGKAALNAFSGDLSEFVPMLLDRPLKKTRSTAENLEAEVEASAVSMQEAKPTAQAKVASQVGAQKDAVTISAVNKFYVPFFRVWVNVANDTFRLDVDASLGFPLGAEAIPGRPKGWNEATSETLEKMKSPAGWLELGGKTVGEVGSSIAGAGKGGKDGALSNRGVQVIVLLAVIGVLAYFVLLGGSGGKTSCSADAAYLKKPNLFEAAGIAPREVNGVFEIRGKCNFTNPGKEDEFGCTSITLIADGVPTKYFKTVCTSKPIAAGINEPRSVPFILNWTDDLSAKNYDLQVVKQ
ncbi:TPA: hypothetical protein HA318_04130 [Candidatus Micrarchaeota archaeon]|nr:hypothetical protein [Candidatus Micrarchaeota archaeon]